MAITKKVFTATNITDSLAEIGKWLTENAAIIGATVSTDTDGNVLLTNANSTNFLKFRDNGYSRAGAEITLDNGVTQKVTDSNSVPNSWSSGYVCENGLALCSKKSNFNAHIWIFIGKTDSEGLCVVAQKYESGLVVYYGDIEKGVKVNSSAKTSTPSSFYFFSDGGESARTSFAPICFDSGEVAASMFLTPQTQYLMETYTGLEMVLSNGGEEFVYSGIVAMKG